MRAILLSIVLAVLLGAGPAQAESADCTLAPAERERLLSLDFNSFDQSQEDGWRPWGYKECDEVVETLIGEYVTRHATTLMPRQKAILRFHAGQILSFGGREQDALVYFRQSYEAEDTAGTMVDWNAYVDATIAFIEKDRPAVEAALARIMQQAPPEGQFLEIFGPKPVNSWVVKGFLDCFDKPYGQAYGECASAARERPD